MKIETFEGKEEEAILANAIEKLGVKEEDIIYYKTSTKAGILKKEIITLHVAKVSDIAEFIKDYLKQLLTNMGLEVTFEFKIRDKQITVKMYSSNNPILIGREGQTLQALTTIVKQVVYNEIQQYPYLILDVEDYKEKQEKRLERLAKKIAKEVSETKVEVSLENMNSYSRRIIHNVLTDNKHVYTESVGEEPNRHVVIKPKRED